MGRYALKGTRLWDERYPFMGKVPVYGKSIVSLKEKGRNALIKNTFF